MAAGLLWPVSVFSQPTGPAFLNGNDLYEKCRQAGDHAYCMAYIMGAVDAFTYDGTLCPSLDVTEGQVQDMVMNLLRADPQTRRYSASNIVKAALERAFPCKK